MKRTIPCSDYTIEIETCGEHVSVTVDSEDFACISDVEMDELDVAKIKDWVCVNYPIWTYADPHLLKAIDFTKDGSTCSDYR